MASWICSRDALALTTMAVVQFSAVGMNTLYKAANLKGLSYFVYFSYSCALGTFLLLCIWSVFSRKKLDSLTPSVLYRIILLSLISFFARICGFKGLEYSSPTLSSAIGTLTPAFTFILAVIFRMEKVDGRIASTRAKAIGTAVSVSGALLAVLYKGPEIISPRSAVAPVLSFPHPLQTSTTNWALGGGLLTVENLLNSSAFILMRHIVMMYPNLLTMSFLNNLFVTIITIPVSFLVESDMSAWRLRQDITLIAVIFSGFFGSAFISTVHTLCSFLKGPLYIAIFAPVSIVVAAAASVIFLGDALYLGSVIGAVILLLGFYAVLWGKAKEEKSMDCTGSDISGEASDGKTPLLRSPSQENV